MPDLYREQTPLVINFKTALIAAIKPCAVLRSRLSH